METTILYWLFVYGAFVESVICGASFNFLGVSGFLLSRKRALCVWANIEQSCFGPTSTVTWFNGMWPSTVHGCWKTLKTQNHECLNPLG